MRLRGEGMVRQRSDGRWEVRVPFRDGKRYAYVKTRDEALSKLREMQALAAGDAPKTSGRLTVRTFMADWLETIRSEVRASTWRCYESTTRLHIVPALGSQKVANLTPRQVNKWLSDLQESGLSPRSAQLARAVLRAALERGVQWGDVQRNVVDLVRSPKVEREEIRPWTMEEAEQFLAAVRGDYLEPLWVCAITLGLRQGELLGLRWRDIDLAAGTIRIVQARLRSKPGEEMFGPPKSRQSRRSLPLPPMTVDALRAHRQRQRELRLAMGPAWVEHGLVFTSHEGRPLDSTNISASFRRRLKRHGMRHTRFHDLRHLCATILLAQGVDLRSIMEWLGHSQISITANLYSHVTESVKRDAADRMQSAFARVAEK